MFLDVTLGDPSDAVYGPLGAYMDLSEVWPQAYVDHLPCGACAMFDETSGAEKKEILM